METKERKMKYILDTIGNTRLVRLKNIGNGNIYVKVEKENATGSIKDRAALEMIKGAIDDGSLKPGMKIVEPTSGNTGIAIAMIGKTLGYEVTIVMPESMSIERRKLMQAYGATIILTGEGGMQAAVDKAKELEATGEYFMPNQFANPYNTLAHEKYTGPEIYSELPEVKGFIAGVGTGGTVSGVGHFLKEKNENVAVWAIEPEESALLSTGKAGGHKIQGIGANFVPEILDREMLDEVITVKGDDALDMARRLAKEEGLLVGISSGANVFGALKMLEKVDGPIVTVLPDTGERYLSTELFENEAN